jgi:hypothetical protein
MFFAFVLLLFITLGGFVVTYFYDEDAPFFVRLCAGAVIGQVLFSLVSFVVGSFAGMSPALFALSAVISTLPLLAWTRQTIRTKIAADFSDFFARVRTFFLRPTLGQSIWSAVWVALLVFLWFFFDRAMLNINGGIGTGSPHNNGDLSFHLQAIYSFLDGQNFPPQNPSFAGAKFTYPFMADLVTAGLAAVGARISEAMFWQNMILIIALIVLLRHFTFKLTGNAFAANIAPLILLFDGGVGFASFIKHALESEAGMFGYLFQMVENYTIRSQSIWRWGNSLTTLFMTQRSLLMGLPLALIILTKIWEIFSQSKERETVENITLSPFHPFTLSILLIGLLAGTLPLVHAHSFAVVMGMTALLALMSLRRWREWFVFFAAGAVVSVPELLWAMLNTANKARNFIDWHFGWDNNGDLNYATFWLVNTGIFIPLLLLAVAWLIYKGLTVDKSVNAAETEPKIQNPKPEITLLLFWLPFALCFIVPNVVRLAPWIWDNVKVLIYWFVLSVPLVALILAQIWQRGQLGKLVTLGLLFILMFSGWLDVWRIATAQMEYTTFERDAVVLAREARQKLPVDAVIGSAPTHSSPAALMGRRWFLGFTGHVWSHGIDPAPRENILKEIYFGSPQAEKLLRENNIQYLVVSPQEFEFTVVNENFLRRFPTIAESGAFRLIQVK